MSRTFRNDRPAKDWRLFCSSDAKGDSMNLHDRFQVHDGKQKDASRYRCGSRDCSYCRENLLHNEKKREGQFDIDLGLSEDD